MAPLAVAISTNDANDTASYNVTEEGTLQLNTNSRDWAINPHGLEASTSQPSGRAATLGEHSYSISRTELVLFDKVGEGASSSVRKAIHVPSHRFVALKKISVDDSDKRQQMLNEIRWLIDCPDTQSAYLVHFFGAFFTPEENNISIVLEYMDGGSLASVLAKVGRIPEPILAHFAVRVLEGLRFLHSERHTIHRDIKPGNLLLNLAGELKLSDFGLAIGLESTLAMVQSFKGTMCYMSPERIKNEPYSYASDVWSLGLTLYECATGNYPFTFDRGPVELCLQITSDQPPALPAGEFSPEFREFVAGCLQKDARSRPSVEQLQQSAFIRRQAGVPPPPELHGLLQQVVDREAHFESIAHMFASYYYRLFDGQQGERGQLAKLYLDTSLLTCDGQKVTGGRPILDKLSDLTTFHPALGRVTHSLKEIDSQPAPLDSGAIILVNGELVGSGPAGTNRITGFSETFVLVPDSTGEVGEYRISNQVRRFT